MAQRFEVQLLSPKEYEDVVRSDPRYLSAYESMGFADPRAGKAFVRNTHWRELNAYLINHEFEHLLNPEDGADKDESGIYHKRGSQIWSNVVRAASVAAAPFTGGLSLLASPAFDVGSAVVRGERAVGKTALASGARTLGAAALPVFGPVGGGIGAGLGEFGGSKIQGASTGQALQQGALMGVTAGVTSAAAKPLMQVFRGAPATPGGALPAPQQVGQLGSASPMASFQSAPSGALTPGGGATGRLAPGGLTPSTFKFNLGGSPTITQGSTPFEARQLLGLAQPALSAFSSPVVNQATASAAGGSPTASPYAPGLGITGPTSIAGAPPGTSPLSAFSTPQSPGGQPQNPPLPDAIPASGQNPATSGIPGQPQASQQPTGLQAIQQLLKGGATGAAGAGLFQSLGVSQQQLEEAARVAVGTGIASAPFAGVGPQVQPMPDLNTLPGVQAFGQDVRGKLTDLTGRAQKLQDLQLPTDIQSSVDREFNRFEDDVTKQFKLFRPGADLATDTGYRDAIMQVRQTKAEANARARLEFIDVARNNLLAELNVSQQMFPFLAELTALEPYSVAQRTGLSLAEANQFREIMGMLGVGVATNAFSPMSRFGQQQPTQQQSR